MPKTTWVSCNACGADDFKELSQVAEWHIGKCRRCSLIYLNPMPFFEPSTEFSDMSLDFQYTQFQHQVTSEVVKYDKKQFAIHVDEMTKFSGNEIRPSMFLDIGCGSGSTVRAATELGWDSTGIDIDPALIKLGQEKLQVNVKCSPLLESGFTDKQFQFIRLRDVIEHLPNPYDAFIEIKRLLMPDGFVLIATPNEDALPTQIRLIFGAKRDKVATVSPPHHVTGFTPKTLTKLLNRVGLEVLSIETVTPVDPGYVTARNMQSADNHLLVLAWKIAKSVGKGSMLIGWARKIEN